MPGKIVPLALSTLVLMSVGNTVADDGDRAAILALMDKAFYAVGSDDPDDMRAIQLAEGTSISFRQHPDGESGELLMRMSTNEALLADTTEDKLVERWTGDPTVMIRGPIAVVWGEYEFMINGYFSHCGVDSIDLVKVDGDWKIANWMWTVEKKGSASGRLRKFSISPNKTFGRLLLKEAATQGVRLFLTHTCPLPRLENLNFSVNVGVLFRAQGQGRAGTGRLAACYLAGTRRSSGRFQVIVKLC